VDSLAGKTAIVMGAGAIGPGWGNGRACAVAYGRAGAAVVCVDRDEGGAEDTASLIRDEGGLAVAVRADATTEHDVKAVVESAVEAFGRIDVLHNNVGVGGSVGAPDVVPLDQWQREIDQNLTSAYLGIRHVVPLMRQQGGGVVINTSSTLAVRFLSHPSAAYTASKAAVEALTRSCAVAYGRDNIRVNCIRIGFSETPLMLRGLDARDMSDEQKATALDRSRRRVPLRGEHGDAFDVAAAALFLASDEARYISGVVLSVDGALELAPL
jgi:NAD(P)-dependent dehydrogenase (short-subunit alcohol dehydrogenase family)